MTPLSKTDKLYLIALTGLVLMAFFFKWAMDDAGYRTAEADKPPVEEQAITYADFLLARREAVEAAEQLPFEDGQEDAPVLSEPAEAVQGPQYDQDTLYALARTVWGEARGCSREEQAAVVWCILNRVDRTEWPDDPLSVVQQPGQFSGYGSDFPVTPEILEVVEDVLARWELEKTTGGDVGRELPKEYVFFEGDGEHNHFRTEYRGGDVWDWGIG